MNVTDRLKEESGQMLIVMVGVMTLVFVIGAIAVDVGLWLSERRGAQTDSDFIALTGAWELIDPGATEGDALDAADAALSGNDEQQNADIANIDVDLGERCVSVDVSHDSARLFSTIFGLATDPDIGAHAKACAGAAQAPGDIVPFNVSDNPGLCFDADEAPLFTALCPIENGAQGGNPRGLLDLDAAPYCSNNAGGANTVAETIEWGADGLCLIDDDGVCNGNDQDGYYDCVHSQNGNTAAVLAGVQARVSREGACDANYGDDDGVDEFSESVVVVFNSGNPLTSIYEARDCDPSTTGIQKSPRLVTIIVLEEPVDTNGYEPIIAFAGFWLAGCGDERIVITSELQLNPACIEDNVRERREQASDLYVMAGHPAPALGHCGQGFGHGSNPTCPPTPTPTPTSVPTATPTPTATPGATTSPTPGPIPTLPPAGNCPTGHCTVFGRFVNLVTSGGDITTPNDQTTIFGISLVE